MSGRLLTTFMTDLYYNLALENAILLEQEKLPYHMTLRIWKNPTSVIIGRNQQVEEEIDMKYCAKHNILIGRRTSGGGAVYHDEGNLNISFFVLKSIVPKNVFSLPEITNFFTELLLRSLENTGITNLSKEGNSSILFKNKKISGSAGYIRKNIVLHHATILLSANLEFLEHVLLARPEYNVKKGRASKYFPTINLLDMFKYESWLNSLKNIIAQQFEISLEEKNVTIQEEALARLLARDMYSQKSWIYDQERSQSSY